jgi:hypothetical protein
VPEVMNVYGVEEEEVMLKLEMGVEFLGIAPARDRI